MVKRLTKKQKAAIDKALADMERDTSAALVKRATAAAIAGDAGAQQAISGKISWALVNQAALDLVKGYAAEIAKGGSTCVVDGRPEFVPWLSDSTAETRSKLVELIEEHIASGGTLGRKEGTQGYQPGSLADKLSTFFTERKSHASTVARTEMSRIRNDAAVGRYVKAGVGRLKYLCGPDPCDICSPFDRQPYDIADAPYLPQHPNCVCGYAPLIDGGEP